MVRIMTTARMVALFGCRLCLALACTLNSAEARDNNDKVVMKNGDSFKGEIKQLRHGELVFKSSYMLADVRLDWDEVFQIDSSNSFVIVLSSGKRLVGSISKGPPKSSEHVELTIVSPQAKQRVRRDEVIELESTEDRFWQRVAGGVDYGFSYTSGNSDLSSSLGARVKYSTHLNSVIVSATSLLNSQTEIPTQLRLAINSDYRRELNESWFVQGLFSYLKSDEQELNFRKTYGGGIGRHLIQKPKLRMDALGGMVYTRESYFAQLGREPLQNNAEALLAIQFSWFRFRTMNASSNLLVFPSLSDPGRVRLISNSSLRLEVVKNLDWSFSLYENFDRRPPIDAPRNDFGATTAVGWTF